MTELVFILDRSGSMAGLEADTIGGFNSMLQKQRLTPGEAVVSTVLFDHETQVIHDRVPLDEVKDLTRDDYYVRGCTALLDAVGGAIHHIGNVHKYARKEDVPEKTMFIITTDGYENASKRYDYEKVRKMTERQKRRSDISAYIYGLTLGAQQLGGYGRRRRFAVASRYCNYVAGAKLEKKLHFGSKNGTVCNGFGYLRCVGADSGRTEDDLIVKSVKITVSAYDAYTLFFKILVF